MRKTQKKGFTLIELIVVIAILAIIAAVAVPTAFASLENARAAACNANVDAILSQYRILYSEELLNNPDMDTSNDDAGRATKQRVLTAAYAALDNVTCPSNGATYTTDVLDDGTIDVHCNNPNHYTDSGSGGSGGGDGGDGGGGDFSLNLTNPTPTAAATLLNETVLLFNDNLADLSDKDFNTECFIPLKSETINEEKFTKKLNEIYGRDVFPENPNVFNAIGTAAGKDYDAATNPITALVYKGSGGGNTHWLYYNEKIYDLTGTKDFEALKGALHGTTDANAVLDDFVSDLTPKA